MANQQLNPATDHGHQDLTQQISDLDGKVEATVQGLRDQLTQLRAELTHLQDALTQTKTDLSDAIKEAKTAAIKDAEDKAKAAAVTTADAIKAAVTALQKNIENGTVIAQKAEMLKARDGSHWMRFREVNGANQDTFMLWRTDNKWFPLIRVQAAAEADEVTSDVLRKIAEHVTYSQRSGYHIFAFPNLQAWDVWAEGGVYTLDFSQHGPPW